MAGEGTTLTELVPNVLRLFSAHVSLPVHVSVYELCSRGCVWAPLLACAICAPSATAEPYAWPVFHAVPSLTSRRGPARWLLTTPQRPERRCANQVHLFSRAKRLIYLSLLPVLEQPRRRRHTVSPLASPPPPRSSSNPRRFGSDYSLLEEASWVGTAKL